VQYFAIAVRCLIAVVFLAAVAGKVGTRARFAAFVASVHAMRLLPPSLARPVALGTIGAELAVPVLLWLPGLTVLASALAATILSGLAVAIGLALRRGVRAPCRCFGASVIPLGPRHVIRNSVLATLAIGGSVAGPLTTTAMRPELAVLSAAAGALGGGLTAMLDEIFALFQPLDTGSARVPATIGRAPAPSQKEASDVFRDHSRAAGGSALRPEPGADARGHQTAARTH